MNLENRRQFSRILFNAQASLQCDQQRVPVSLVDISLRGALIRPGEPLDWQPGTACTLEVTLDGSEVRISMQATIAHHRNEEIGLVCREIDLDSMTHLRRLVELNLGDEAILHRELNALTGQTSLD